MKILVAGATGVLGRALLRELRGHDVVALSRSDANDATIRALGATPARADLFDADAIARAASGCEAIVRAATSIPAVARPKPAHFAPNDRIRREGTAALLAAAKRAGVSYYVQESVAWARVDDPVTASAVEAERLARASGIASATLRFGWFYAADSGQTQALAQMIKARRLPVLGDGATRLSFLHVDDAARAIVAALETRAVGAFDVVDDEPATTARYFDAFARALGASPPRRVPVWLGRLGAGSFVARFLTTPMPRSNAEFKKATGWEPRYPTVEDGLRAVAAQLSAARPSSSA